MEMGNPGLSLETLVTEAAVFAGAEDVHDEPLLYGVTDGKAVGTYLEHKFINYLKLKYSFTEEGNSGFGIDIPDLNVDIKVTSIKQPQSSCPFRLARQKVYGLGYHLLVFVYSKHDDVEARVSRLNMLHTIFVDQSCTGDYQMTRGILDILDRDGTDADLVSFLLDKNLPVDDIGAQILADEILESPPPLGFPMLYSGA